MATLQEAIAQGWQAQRAGKFAVAEQIYQRILEAKPDHPEVLYLLGTVCHRLGKVDDAAQHLLMAVSLKPDYAEAHNNLGVVMAIMGRRIDAITLFRHVVRLRPNDPDAANNLGNALREQGELNEAVERLRHSLNLRPDFPDALHNLGLALFDLNQPDEAVASLSRAVQLRPDFADAHADLGMILAKQKKWSEALAHFQQLVQLRPDSGDGHMHLGSVLRELGKLDESADRLRHAARLKPDDANLRSGLGLTLQMLGQLNEAEEHLRVALKLAPDHADAHNNLAVTLAQLNRFTEAIEHYDHAIRIQPDHAIFHRNRALGYLTLGDFSRGWAEYEYRWKCPGFVERNYPQPRWTGESLSGKTILLYGEQGLGDTLQFIRYAAMVKDLGARVIVEVPAVLPRLLAKVDGVDLIVPVGEKLPHFDTHCSLMSLPGVFQSNFQTIPSRVPYLHAEPERVSFWRGQLSAFPGFKIGICWQGNPKQGGDRLRSIPLIHFASLARLDGVRLFSLQKGPGSEQLRDMADPLPIVDLSGRLDLSGGAFLDTAAVMSCLDLVITCDTAIGHLAGALGAQVWLALCAAPDWRWFTERDDTPWYPTMRLFRQHRLGRWDDVFASIHEEVKKKLARPANAQSVPIDISPGELIDKITILQIKSERVKDPAKLRNVRIELAALTAARDHSLPPVVEIARITDELKQVNELLWDVEDRLRQQEHEQKFDDVFVQLARSVYINNDQRAALKRKINEYFSAQFIEEKEHPKY